MPNTKMIDQAIINSSTKIHNTLMAHILSRGSLYKVSKDSPFYHDFYYRLSHKSEVNYKYTTLSLICEHNDISFKELELRSFGITIQNSIPDVGYYDFRSNELKDLIVNKYKVKFTQYKDFFTYAKHDFHITLYNLLIISDITNKSMSEIIYDLYLQRFEKKYKFE